MNRFLMSSYQDAMKRGQEANLSPTIPVLLGLALNYSVFYYEILNNPDKVIGCVVDKLRLGLRACQAGFRSCCG